MLTTGTGTYQGIKLSGRTPNMGYTDNIIDALVASLRERFDLREPEIKVLHATKVLHFQNWPSPDSPVMQSLKNADLLNGCLSIFIVASPG